MTVQTLNALKTIGYVSDLVSYMEVTQIRLFFSVGKKSQLHIGKINCAWGKFHCICLLLEHQHGGSTTPAF